MTAELRARGVGAARVGKPLVWLVVVASALLPACQQKMARQPSYRPLEQTAFFADERASRPLMPGTVPRGVPVAGSPLASGRTEARAAAAVAGAAAVGNVLGALAQGARAADPASEYTSIFPFPTTVADVERGRQRFTIFCAVCHDAVGSGNGIIVQRGYLRPPNLATDFSRGFERLGQRLLLRQAPVGYFFEVMTRGFGAMPDYSSQIPVEDRWRIAAYVRALQFSQNARLLDLPAAEREAARRALEGPR